MDIRWIFGILIILFLIALWAELRDYIFIFKQPQVNSLPIDQQQDQLTFYACAAYENGVLWRETLLPTIIVTFIICYILYILKVKLEIWLVLLILLVVFVPFYGMASFKNYHYHRVSCARSRKNMIML